MNKKVFFFLFLTYFILSAWGPERDTYDFYDTPTTPTINSVTNNPQIGNEKNFVRIREDFEDTNFTDSVEISPNKTYIVYNFLHNNAYISDMDTSTTEKQQSIATDVTMKTSFPSILYKNEQGIVKTIITSSNSIPNTIWDEAFMTTKNNKIKLELVPNSATINTNGKLNGSLLSPNLFQEGTHMGYDEFDGVIPGGSQYASIILYKLKASIFSIENKIEGRKKGDKTWSDSIVVNSNEEVEIRVTCSNVGNNNINAMILKIPTPNTLQVDPLSPIASSTANKDELNLSSEWLEDGFSMKNIPKNESRYVTFSVLTPNANSLKKDNSTFKVFSYLSNKAEKEDKSFSITVKRKNTFSNRFINFISKADNSNIFSTLLASFITFIITRFWLRFKRSKMKTK